MNLVLQLTINIEIKFGRNTVNSYLRANFMDSEQFLINPEYTPRMVLLIYNFGAAFCWSRMERRSSASMRMSRLWDLINRNSNINWTLCVCSAIWTGGDSQASRCQSCQRWSRGLKERKNLCGKFTFTFLYLIFRFLILLLFQLAENLDWQLARMGEDLKEIISHSNTSAKYQDSKDPVYQIGKVFFGS